MNLPLIILLIIIAILFILSLYWEIKDYQRLQARPPLNQLPENQIQKEQEFYACFNYHNKVIWRPIMLLAGISTVVLWLIASMIGITLPPYFWLLVFFVIFVIAFVLESFKSYHLYRLMCDKVTNNIQPI